MNRKPPELHVVDGTKSRRGNDFVMPEELKSRIPKAEWADNPDAWDKDRFIDETSDFLLKVYGIGNDQDKHTLTILADHLETYIQCNKAIAKGGLISSFNNGRTIGSNPYLTLRNKTTPLIIHLMNELGLTPRGRLSSNKLENRTPQAALMRGPVL